MKNTKNIENMSKEEILEYRKTLNEQINATYKREEELHQEEVKKELIENESKLNELRKHKDIILMLAPNHDRNCNDKTHENDFMEGYYPRCRRCMLINILENDYINEYKINFDIEIKEIK